MYFCYITVISGINPLHAAIGNRDLQTTKLLLRHNANVAAKTMIKHKRQEERLCDPYELAVDLLQWDIVNLLIEYGYNLSQHEYLRDSVFLETIPGALKNDPSMFSLLQETARTPRSLQKLVVLRVRDILKIDISNKVQSLSLPNSLRNDIIMVESSWQFSANPTIHYRLVHVSNKCRFFNGEQATITLLKRSTCVQVLGYYIPSIHNQCDNNIIADGVYFVSLFL